MIQNPDIPEAVSSADLMGRLTEAKTPPFGSELITHLEQFLAEPVPAEYKNEDLSESLLLDMESFRSKLVAIQTLRYPEFGNRDLDEGLSLFRQHVSEAQQLANPTSLEQSNLYNSYVRAHAKIQDALTVLKLVLRK